MDGAMGQWMDGWTEEKIGEWREEGGRWRRWALPFISLSALEG